MDDFNEESGDVNEENQNVLNQKEQEYQEKVEEIETGLKAELRQESKDLMHKNMVMILRNKNILGPEAQDRLEKAGITINKNSIPYDPNPPFKPSGIRLGTPAITTRGMKEKEMMC